MVLKNFILMQKLNSIIILIPLNTTYIIPKINFLGGILC